MKNNLKSTFHTKISLKAIKPEENIFEIFPTEKTKRKMSKNKYFSPEFSILKGAPAQTVLHKPL